MIVIVNITELLFIYMLFCYNIYSYFDPKQSSKVAIIIILSLNSGKFNSVGPRLALTNFK